MQRRLFILLLFLAVVPALLFASGKLRGKVTDAGTGEALVGANVVVVGTSMGAATNVSGEYTILNVPAGTYTLKTTYVGYQAITISNIRVNNDLTTEQNFQLPAEGVTVATVEIVAERPLVNKSATNAVRIVDQEFFSKIPARGINTALAVQPGVVSQAGNIYIRGGRADEVGYRVEGVGANDILFGGRALNVTAEAVEQIQVQAGGFNAEYGGANAGIVQAQLRSGNPDKWKASVLLESDNYTSQGKKSLGGYSFGYSDITGTLGGPVMIMNNKLRLFGSFENTFYRDPSVTVRAPWDFSGANAIVADPQLTPAHPTAAQRDTLNIVLPGGNALGGFNNLWAFTGTAVMDFGPVQIRGAGSYSYTRSQDQTVLANVFNQSRLPLHIQRDGLGNLRLSHVINPTTFYEVNLNYYTNTFLTEDPQLGGNLMAYGDSAANAALGYQLRGNSLNWSAFPLWGGAFTVNQPGAQINGYERRKVRSLGGRVDLTTQWKSHEIKIGGEYTRYTIRRYNPGGVFAWNQLSRDVPDPTKFMIALHKGPGGTVGADNYGYDIFGNEINDNVEYDGAYLDFGPRKPVFAAGYIQDKIEFSDIILNLGLRYDYIDPDSWDVVDPTNLHFSPEDLILVSDYRKTDKTAQISPRIGFSFPASDRTVFHAQYGKFIQQTRMRDVYEGAGYTAGLVKSGFFITNTFGWGLKPTRTTQYEIGFSQQISDLASFDITAFYKDIQDQVQFTYFLPASGSQNANYGAYINGDFSTSKGLEFKFILRRTNRVQAQVNYTFSNAATTGSNPASVAGIWSAGSIVDYPKYVFNADFDQTHRGSVLLDYRFAKDDGGPILQQLGANLLLQFNSGHAMTRLDAAQRGPNPTDPRFRTPIEPIGSSTTPWFFELDARLDKTVPIGPLDVNFYIYVINLLGTDNPVNAFIRTANAKDDGWFSTAAGKADAAINGAQYVAAYNAFNLGDNSLNFGPPRQIRFGLKLDY